MNPVRAFAILLFVLFPCLAVQAQQITDTRAALAGVRFGGAPDTNVSFAVGMLRPQDTTYRSEVYTGDTITVSANIRPETQHTGLPADVFAIVRVGTAFFMINEVRKLVPWNGNITALVPVQAGATLQASHEFTIFSGSIPQAVAFQVFLGYMPQGSSALYYTPVPQTLRIASAPAAVGQCTSYGGRTVPVWHTSATGIFTHTPFLASDLGLITNGNETNDPRFSYQWLRNPTTAIPIYAPADGVLIRLRHKAENLPEFPSDDFDLIFLVACDPARPGEFNSIVRFNHITNPRPDIRAAYGFGNLGAPTFNPFVEHEERQVPTTNIVVRAGDYLGSTTGTPFAHNFDFEIAINDVTVCPFTVLEAPHASLLLNMLGPIGASPAGPPVAGYPCAGYGARP